MNESKPFGSEAFIAEQESGLRSGHLLFRADVVERLIGIAREQQTKIADLELANGMNRLAAKGLGDTASRAMTENAQLRDRVAKLEAIAARAENERKRATQAADDLECSGSHGLAVAPRRFAELLAYVLGEA